jgi:hypothetical protein
VPDRPANDQLFVPRTLWLEEPLYRPLRATLWDNGTVTCGDTVSQPMVWAAQFGRGISDDRRMQPIDWLVPFCRMLIAAGADPRRALIVRRRDLTPVLTATSIAEVVA